MKNVMITLALVATSALALGCTETKTVENKSNSTTSGKTDGHDHDSHEDNHKAPHGGVLIDLGRNHEYHAELVDDHKTESITIYMMDGKLKPLSINQPSVTLILTAGENTQSFEVKAVSEDGSSEFTSKDEKLMELIEAKNVKGKLRATIEGKAFSGTFSEVVHDHDGHDHEKDEHNH